jgi:hypothetical protein
MSVSQGDLLNGRDMKDWKDSTAVFWFVVSWHFVLDTWVANHYSSTLRDLLCPSRNCLEVILHLRKDASSFAQQLAMHVTQEELHLSNIVRVAFLRD